MKVIVAGYPKTGTKSMNSALTQLGFKVYDFPEHVMLLKENYCKIWEEGWTAEDFREMYKDADAVLDMPAVFFWEELHQAFPSAKIILTMRDNEDAWFKSIKNQLEVGDTILFRLMGFLSPSFRSFLSRFWNDFVQVAMAAPTSSLLGLPMKYRINENLMKKKYRAHNSHVLECVPKDKLLVLKCSEGWEPLCKFLEVDVPQTPFPHRNVRGEYMNEVMKYPEVRKMIREVMISSVLLVTATGCCVYFTCKYGIKGLAESVLNCAESLYNNIKL